MIKELLKNMNERPVAFQPVYIKLTWSVTTWYLLSQIVYWYYKMDWEFYKTDQEWMDELYIWSKALRNAKKTLKELWFVKIKARWNPPITYYDIDEDLLIKFLCWDLKKDSSWFSPKGEIDLAQRDKLKRAKGRNWFSPKGNSLITETTTETTTESIPKGIEQSSQEKTINISKNEEIEDSLDIPKTEIQEQEKEKKVPAEKSEKSVPQEYWDSQINSMYALLKKAVWVDEFTETQKWQRVYAKHFLNWWVKNGREELILRLKSILEDPYKQKRSNSIAFLYNEVKAYIHSPVVQTNRKNSKRQY